MTEKQRIFEITLEDIAPARERFDKVHKTFKQAIDAYNADLAGRRETLAARAQEIEAEIKQAEEKRAALAAQATDRLSRGDLDGAAELESEVEQIEAQLVTLERKKRMAAAAELRGDDALYKAALEAEAEAGKAENVYLAERNALDDRIIEQIKRLENVRDLLKTSGTGLWYSTKALERIKATHNAHAKAETPAKVNKVESVIL